MRHLLDTTDLSLKEIDDIVIDKNANNENSDEENNENIAQN